MIGAQVRDESRIDWWNQDAKKVVEEFRSELPEGVQIDIIFDQMPYVEARFIDLFNNFILGGIAVFLSTLIFLGWRSALVTTLLCL